MLAAESWKSATAKAASTWLGMCLRVSQGAVMLSSRICRLASTLLVGMSCSSSNLCSAQVGAAGHDELARTFHNVMPKRHHTVVLENDTGLFTGETLMHIALGMEDTRC